MFFKAANFAYLLPCKYLQTTLMNLSVNPKLLVLASAIFFITATSFTGCNKNNDVIVNPPTEYINYYINGTPYSYTVPQDNFTCILDNQIMFFVYGFKTSVPDTVKMIVTGGNNGTMNLQGFVVPQFSSDPISTIFPPRTVTISEYPSGVGDYLAGNFSLVFVGQPPTNNNYNVTCNFRVRRDQ